VICISREVIHQPPLGLVRHSVTRDGLSYWGRRGHCT